MVGKAGLLITLILAACTSTIVWGSFEIESGDYDGPGNPTLTVCPGDQVILTCQNDMVSNEASQWNFVPQFPGCTRRIVDHNNPDSINACGPFTFHNVTGLQSSPTELSSTAVAIANASIDGLLIRCLDSDRNSANEIGDISLCVIGKPSIIGNISILNKTDDSAVISWDPIEYEDCAANTTTVVYDVSVTTSDSQGTGSGIPVSILSETSAMISNLSPGREYTATVTVAREAGFGNSSCFVGAYPQVSVMLSTSKGFNIHMWTTLLLLSSLVAVMATTAM